MEVNREVCELHTKEFKSRLDQHEESIKQLTACNLKLTCLMENQTERMNDVSKRLKKIEGKSGDIFEKILIGSITALITFIVTYLIGG